MANFEDSDPGGSGLREPELDAELDPQLIDDNLSNDDRAKLVGIIVRIRVILARIVWARHILFRRSLRTHILKSWQTLQDEKIFDRLINAIQDPNEVEDDVLSKAGLSGHQLSLKYQGIFEAYNHLNQKAGGQRLKRAIRWAKIVVGSLATMVPVLKELAEILNEYMEAVEMGIDDAEGAD